VEFPAVVDAAQPAFLIPAEKQTGTAVRAMVLYQPHLAARITKSDELLTQNERPHWLAVWRRQLAGQQHRQPVLAHQLAHRRAGPDARNQLVVFSAQHSYFAPAMASMYSLRTCSPPAPS